MFLRAQTISAKKKRKRKDVFNMPLEAIRRIDDLGRIVVPKDIRKRLNLEEGDTVSLETTNDALVIKKHSVIGEITKKAQACIDALSFSTKSIIIATDKNVITNVAGLSKRNLLEMGISDKLKELIKNNKKGYRHTPTDEPMPVMKNSAIPYVKATAVIYDKALLPVGCVAIITSNKAELSLGITPAEEALLNNTADTITRLIRD